MPASVTLTASGWITRGHAAALGQAHDPSGRLLRAGDLAARFDALDDDERWLAAIAELNGCFAVVCAHGAEVRAAVDRIRSIPLFFAGAGASLVVSDTAERVRSALPPARVDEVSRREFALTGYVTGEHTLIDGVKQLRAGHCLFSRANDMATAQKRYYEFRHGAFFDDGEAAIRDRLVGVHERVFRRLVDDVSGRPIVLPLSGGYDSRLIAVMLRELGYRDVLCFCYGAPGNWEAAISREVAGHLGFRWTMVPYSAARWRDCAASAEFKQYFRNAGNLVSLPHLQDWPAMRELVQRGELQQGAVLVPGHTGDFLTGNHIPKGYPDRARITRAEILRSILDAHYSLWECPADEALRAQFHARIEADVDVIATCTPEAAADLYECWEWQERQAKFIVNSVRVYESFGFEWRLPWWDHELMDFWSRVPLAARVGRSLYLQYAAQHQALPITRANADHARLVATAIAFANRAGLRPLAKRAQRTLHRIRWRQQYEGDPMRWFSLVELQQFRGRYTGRETGHSFFALQYLATALA